MDRCESCYRPSHDLQRDATGAMACRQCFVPDITGPKYRDLATEDVMVAPPNAKNVTPRVSTITSGRFRPCDRCGGTPAVHNGHPENVAYVGHEYA
jgi:hypothetical protein